MANVTEVNRIKSFGPNNYLFGTPAPMVLIAKSFDPECPTGKVGPDKGPRVWFNAKTLHL